MAERKVILKIEADTSQFERDVDDSIRRVSNRAVIGPRAGSAAPAAESGQRTTPPVGYSSGEFEAGERAIATARSHADRHMQRAGSSAPSYGGGGGQLNIDASVTETTFRRVKSQFDELVAQISKPIKLNFDMSGFPSGGGVSAGSAPGSQHAAPQGAFPAGLSSQHLPLQLQQAVQQGMFPTGAASPNWSYLLNRQGATQRAGATVPRSSRLFGAPTGGAIRGLLFGAAIGELSGAVNALRDGEAESQFAGSVEEYNQIQAQALVNASNGPIGRALSLIPDYFAPEYSPQQILRDRQRDARLKESGNQNRINRVERIGERQVLEAFRSGSSASEIKGLEASRDAELEKIRIAQEDAAGLLNAQDTYTERVWEDSDRAEHGVGYQMVTRTRNRITGEERKELEKKSADLADKYKNISEEYANKIKTSSYEMLRDIGDSRDRASLFGMSSRNTTLNESAFAEGERKVEGEALRLKYDRAVANANAPGGAGPIVAKQIEAEGVEAKSEMTARHQRQRAIEYRQNSEDTLAIQGNAAVADLLRQYRPLDAKIRDINNQSDRAIEQAQKTMQPGTELDKRVTSLKDAAITQVKLAQQDFNDQFNQQSRAYAYAGSSAKYAIENKPVESQLAIIAGRRNEAIIAANQAGLNPEQLASRLKQIDQDAANNAFLAQRDFKRNEGDTADRLRGAISRTQIGIDGGVDYQERQQASQIAENANMDIRQLRRAGQGDNAEKRWALGRLQLDEANRDYFRSFQSQESAGDRSFGVLNPNSVRKAFEDARKDIKADGGAGPEGDAPKGQQIDRLIGILEAIQRDGLVGLLG